MNIATIVCREIAIDGKPILYAERSAPEDPADSGWQFLCGAAQEDWREAKVWSMDEVLHIEPSLREYIDLPVGTILWRESATGAWQIEQRAPRLGS